MKNFPSSLIKQKTTRQGLADSASGTLKNIGTKVLKNIFGADESNVSVDTLNSQFDKGYEILDISQEIDDININKYHKPLSKLQENKTSIDSIIYDHNETVSFNANMLNGKLSAANNVYFEDPFLFSSSIFSVINNYKYILKSSVPSVLQHPVPDNPEDEKTDFKMSVIHSVVAPSLFNPFNGVDVTGITEHVPLMITGNKDLDGSTKIEDGFGDDTPGKSEKVNLTLNTTLPEGYDSDEDISDCTIKTLVELSKKGKDSPLGLATYRYADFMFCKDLGKISNNHLITLRRFPGPIGDNIFQEAYPDKDIPNNPFAAYPDIGRMITWFGNEDNKLEDICRFNYRATWKPFTSEIKEIPSQQKDDGILDNIANSFSPQNNKLIGEGFSGNTGLLQWGAAKMNLPIIHNDRMNSPTYGWDLLSNYDQHRIYEPANTIWDTHKYEGKLEFNQEITLTFRYVLRSYANINPKSAFLDLLGNIMLVTYRRGTFWGGETKIFGPQGNNSVYKTADAWIDKGFDLLGGVWKSISTGSFSLQALQGWLSNAANAVINKAAENSEAIAGIKDKKGTDAVVKGAKNDVSNTAKKVEKLNKKYGWTDALKGMLKNQLGRPAMYAANSILTGEAVGPWHLTIGNPRNPIMSMGNMIIDSPVEIQQSGPLGIDDFPSEIKVTVTLKHGRPRDAVEIEKMYTKGRSSIYKPMNLMDLKQYKNNPNAFGDIMTIKNLGGDFEYTSTVQTTKTNNGKETKSSENISSGKVNLADDVFAKILRNI